MMVDYKIFLVDDDLFCLHLHEQHLKTLGIRDISKFETGTDCLNNLIEYPDIIFLDHKMDTLSGFDVLKKVKRFDPNINVVMISGQEDLQTAINSLKFGAFDYIIKCNDIQSKITDVLSRIEKLDNATKKKKSSILKSLFTF